MSDSKHSKINSQVFIVDDHEAIRVGLKTILAKYHIDVVGDAATIEEAVQKIPKKKIDVLVVDLNMGEYKGALTIDHILAHLPDAKVVVYSMRETTPIITAVYEEGARAFVAKSADPKILAEAIQKVAAGEAYFMPETGEQIALFLTAKETNPRRVLTPRELEIFAEMAMGKSPEEIAQQYGIGTRTVRNYGFTIRQKLDITNAEMRRVAENSGIIGTPSE